MVERIVMKQEEKELLLKDLCARLPYGVKFACNKKNVYTATGLDLIVTDEGYWEYAIAAKNIAPIEIYYIKPYLFPLSSMTEEEAKELSILYGIKDILSINITDEYIDFKVDDGFCSFERKTIWYNEIISSTETFDWLNENHFDYRGLIEKGLAIDATGLGIY